MNNNNWKKVLEYIETLSHKLEFGEIVIKIQNSQPVMVEIKKKVKITKKDKQVSKLSLPQR